MADPAPDDPAPVASAPRVLGHIQEFDPQIESVTTYLGSLQLYSEANGVEAERQVPVLLTFIGPKVYATLCS